MNDYKGPTKRAIAGMLACLLLTGCAPDGPDISVSTSKYSANIYAKNDYQISGYQIVDNEDGSYTVMVTAARGR